MLLLSLAVNRSSMIVLVTAPRQIFNAKDSSNNQLLETEATIRSESAQESRQNVFTKKHLLM